jgi:hypothetical protein
MLEPAREFEVRNLGLWFGFRFSLDLGASSTRTGSAVRAGSVSTGVVA